MSKTQTKEQQIKECGTKFLNAFINGKLEPQYFSDITTQFKKDIENIDQENASKIIQEYNCILDLIAKSVQLFDQRTQIFERRVLRLSSIIMRSQLVEQQIHDTIYYKDLLRYKEDTIKATDKMIAVMEKTIEDIDKSNEISQEEKAKLQKNNTTALEFFKAQKDNLLKDEEQRNAKIEHLKKSEDYIVNVSEIEDIPDFLNLILIAFLDTELLESIKQALLKKYKIKWNKRNVFVDNETKRPLELMDYHILIKNIANLLSLSLLNSGKNVIDSRVFNQLTTITLLEEHQSTKDYKELLKKHTNEVLKVLENMDFKPRVATLQTCIADNTKQFLKELRW